MTTRADARFRMIPPLHSGTGRLLSSLGTVSLAAALPLILVSYVHDATVGPVAIAVAALGGILLLQGESNFLASGRYRLYLLRHPLGDMSRPAQTFEEAAARLNPSVRKAALGNGPGEGQSER